MELIARSVKQVASIIRRFRHLQGLTQGQIGEKIKIRQATVSKLEAGEPATQLQTFFDVLTALDLEIIIRPRTKTSAAEIEEIFS
jgi:HTH-type transcriptional regulator/antitoxin HipB